LSVVEGRRTAGMPGISRGEMEKAARDGEAEPPRTRLVRIVREAATSKDEAEFVRRVRRAGVSIRSPCAAGGRDTVVGYSVGRNPKRLGHDHLVRRKVPCTGPVAPPAPGVLGVFSQLDDGSHHRVAGGHA